MNKTEVNKKRHILVAILLFILNAGAYLYVGKPKRFLYWCAFNILLVVIKFHGLWGLASQPKYFLLILFVAIVGYLVFFLDVMRITMKRKIYTLQPYNKLWIYILVSVSFMGFTTLSQQLHDKSDVQNYVIPSRSMTPTLLPQDRVVARKFNLRHNQVKRGDLVIYNSRSRTFGQNEAPEVKFIKRIIAVPNDSIFINGNQIIVTKKDDVVQTYPSTIPSRYWTFENTQPYTLKDNEYFAIGDNESNSNDSRQNGPIKESDIVAIVQGILISKDRKVIAKTF